MRNLQTASGARHKLTSCLQQAKVQKGSTEEEYLAPICRVLMQYAYVLEDDEDKRYITLTMEQQNPNVGGPRKG
jgi:hypothetical protein